MRLTLHSDYAIRILIHLGLSDGRLVTIDEISKAYGISKNHLMKIAHKLANEGYVVSVRGRNGGLRLAQPPQDINIGTMIRWTEDNSGHVECFDKDANQCAIAPCCRFKGALREALEAYFGILDRYSLADFLVPTDPLRELLAIPRPLPL